MSYNSLPTALSAVKNTHLQKKHTILPFSGRLFKINNLSPYLAPFPYPRGNISRPKLNPFMQYEVLRLDAQCRTILVETSKFAFK